MGLGSRRRTAAVEVAVVADDGARAPVEAAAELVPYPVGVLVRRAAVVEYTVPQHLQSTALQLCHAPATSPHRCILMILHPGHTIRYLQSGVG